MGYVGPCVVSQLRAVFPHSTLIGYDMAYFASCLTNTDILPESKLNIQFIGDVREMQPEVMDGVDIVVHLAAISNDPMGNRYEDVTMDVNYRSSLRVARMAKDAGVNSFIFASSCSIYGAGGEGAKTESSELDPLTAYARSKVFTEKGLEQIAGDGFTVTCLRFATACGMSPRVRLDLVLNDFVAGAVASGNISILSDGSPWRPLIHVRDMARAVEWAITRTPVEENGFLALNVGSNEWNYQIKELAEAVAGVIPCTELSINRDAAPDKRSYNVNFNLFKSLAPDHQPLYTLKRTVEELYDALVEMKFQNEDFRDSRLMRLKVLTNLQNSKYINDELVWSYKTTEEIPL